MTLQHMEEKNEHKRVMVCLKFFGNIPQIATDNNCYIKMYGLMFVCVLSIDVYVVTEISELH